MAIDLAALVAYVRQHNTRATFDGRIAELERICRRDLVPKRVVYDPSGQPREVVGPIPESREWYAQEMLDAIAATKHQLAGGPADIAASEAMVIGALAATAAARYDWPEVQGWNAHLAMLRKGSKAGVQTNRQKAITCASTLRPDVDACRLKHPTWSLQRIAHALLATHGRQSGNRQKDLTALAKRIRRLNKENKTTA